MLIANKEYKHKEKAIKKQIQTQHLNRNMSHCFIMIKKSVKGGFRITSFLMLITQKQRSLQITNRKNKANFIDIFFFNKFLQLDKEIKKYHYKYHRNGILFKQLTISNFDNFCF